MTTFDRTTWDRLEMPPHAKLVADWLFRHPGPHHVTAVADALFMLMGEVEHAGMVLRAHQLNASTDESFLERVEGNPWHAVLAPTTTPKKRGTAA